MENWNILAAGTLTGVILLLFYSRLKSVKIIEILKSKLIAEVIFKPVKVCKGIFNEFNSKIML